VTDEPARTVLFELLTAFLGSFFVVELDNDHRAPGVLALRRPWVLSARAGHR